MHVCIYKYIYIYIYIYLYRYIFIYIYLYFIYIYTHTHRYIYIEKTYQVVFLKAEYNAGTCTTFDLDSMLRDISPVGRHISRVIWPVACVYTYK
jgi:hypothetical protein